MTTQDLYVRMTRDGVRSRRSFLCGAAAGLVGLGWAEALRAEADGLRRRGMACILLFMQGGPSQFETFDPKPGTDTGGPTAAIATAVPGVRIAEHWPKLAARLKDVALLRSVTSTEGNHPRAQFLLHTSYPPSGSVKYPGFGSTVACELGDPAFDLPHFVCVGGTTPAGPGYLGAQHAPYQVGDPNQLPLNAALPPGVDAKVLRRRLGLLGRLEQDFADAGAKTLVADHQALNDTAARLVTSPHLRAFDLKEEKDALRDEYGRTPFGQGCLLARRLVEAGVTFIEVVSNGWDTHQENFTGHQRLAGSVDPACAALLRDLKERGLLERTLVVWMGEFGRTPRINPRNGRDHYPRAFSAALAGAGVRGGQVIGGTDRDGYEVSDRPVTVADLFCTFCHALKINPRKAGQANGRPIKIVEGGAPVKEVFGA